MKSSSTATPTPSTGSSAMAAITSSTNVIFDVLDNAFDTALDTLGLGAGSNHSSRSSTNNALTKKPRTHHNSDPRANRSLIQSLMLNEGDRQLHKIYRNADSSRDDEDDGDDRGDRGYRSYVIPQINSRRPSNLRRNSIGGTLPDDRLIIHHRGSILMDDKSSNSERGARTLSLTPEEKGTSFDYEYFKKKSAPVHSSYSEGLDYSPCIRVETNDGKAEIERNEPRTSSVVSETIETRSRAGRAQDRVGMKKTAPLRNLQNVPVSREEGAMASQDERRRRRRIGESTAMRKSSSMRNLMITSNDDPRQKPSFARGPMPKSNSYRKLIVEDDNTDLLDDSSRQDHHVTPKDRRRLRTKDVRESYLKIPNTRDRSQSRERRSKEEKRPAKDRPLSSEKKSKDRAELRERPSQDKTVSSKDHSLSAERKSKDQSVSQERRTRFKEERSPTKKDRSLSVDRRGNDRSELHGRKVEEVMESSRHSPRNNRLLNSRIPRGRDRTLREDRSPSQENHPKKRQNRSMDGKKIHTTSRESSRNRPVSRTRHSSENEKSDIERSLSMEKKVVAEKLLSGRERSPYEKTPQKRTKHFEQPKLEERSRSHSRTGRDHKDRKRSTSMQRSTVKMDPNDRGRSSSRQEKMHGKIRGPTCEDERLPSKRSRSVQCRRPPPIMDWAKWAEKKALKGAKQASSPTVVQSRSGRSVSLSPPRRIRTDMKHATAKAESIKTKSGKSLQSKMKSLQDGQIKSALERFVTATTAAAAAGGGGTTRRRAAPTD